jgi:hypothetical protein
MDADVGDWGSLEIGVDTSDLTNKQTTTQTNKKKGQ